MVTNTTALPGDLIGESTVVLTLAGVTETIPQDRKLNAFYLTSYLEEVQYAWSSWL